MARTKKKCPKCERMILLRSSYCKRHRVITKEFRQKISDITKGERNPFYGKTHSEEAKKKIGEKSWSKGRAWGNGLKKGLTPWNKGKTYHHTNPRHPSTVARGESHYAWKGGNRNRDIHSLRNPAYVQWRNGVFERDKYCCRIATEKCSGKLEVHHILRWSEYPELRYNLNNGIALCHAHHPRKRAEEKRLEPIFRELVSVSSVLY